MRRVAQRVGEGGHGVPEGKVRERYDRTMALLGPAMRLSDRACLFYNSGTAPILVASYDGEQREFTLVGEEGPAWIATLLSSLV